MTKRKDLNLVEYNISKERYRELYYFCLQYNERLRQIGELRFPSSFSSDGLPRGNSVGKPTEQAAVKAAELSRKNEAMEQAAIEADATLYPWILESIKYGLSFFDLQTLPRITESFGPIPCYEREYIRVRRKFFYYLDKKI